MDTSSNLETQERILKLLDKLETYDDVKFTKEFQLYLIELPYATVTEKIIEAIFNNKHVKY